jgi:hypothetical protein
LSAPDGEKRGTGAFAVARAVFWSFLGIRRKSDYHQDAVTLKPHHVVIAGIVGGVLFVLTLVLVVRMVLSN